MEISTGLKQQLSTDKDLPYRKYYGFKLTETSWWVVSKVCGCHRYLDVYVKLAGANT